MIFLIQALNPIFDLAWWVVLIAFIVAIYRTYQLPSVPWILACLAAGFITVPVGQYYFRQFHIQSPSILMPFEGLTTWPAVITALFGSLSDLVMLLLVLADVSFVLSRAYPAARPLAIRIFLALHRRHALIGVLGLIAVVIYPLPAIIYGWLQ